MIAKWIRLSKRRNRLKNLNKTSVITTCLTAFALMLLFVTSAFAQEKGETAKLTVKDTETTTPGKTEPRPILIKAPTLFSPSAAKPAPADDDSAWHFELRPYLWAVGLYGTLRVGNQTSEVGRDSKNVLGMLDFAAAAQVEAIRGRW